MAFIHEEVWLFRGQEEGTEGIFKMQNNHQPLPNTSLKNSAKLVAILEYIDGSPMTIVKFFPLSEETSDQWYFLKFLTIL